MSRIKKTSPLQNLSNFQTFIVDNNPLSQYFKISELGDLFTAGKNGFLIEGSTFLKPSTEIKIEVLDTEGNPLFVQPGEGIPEYYEGLSKLIGVYVYEDTPIGIGKITILGELDKYLDENGFIQPIPEDWEGIYNIKWERDIKINKNIPNETRVRFVRRPEVIIEELNESFYSRNLVNATQNDGLVRGVALTPSEGTTLRGYRGGIRYLIQKQSGVFADGGTYISVTGTNIQNAEIVEYLNNTSVIVATPFTSSDGLVSNFSGKNYSLSYQYNQNPVASSILGSFGRFEINHLQTFVGDVERIKVFKKSRASNVDYEVIQDTRVEPTELLTTIISGSAIDVGHFSQSYENGQSWTSFWNVTNGATLDSSKIYKSLRLQNSRLSTNLGDDIRLESGSEYALEFYNYYDTSSNNINDTLKVYLTSTLRSGSGISNYYVTQSLATFTGSNEFRGANKRVFNFVPPITDNWTINFEASNTTANSYWHVGSVSLKASHELGFSPDEFSFIIPVDRDLERETFDFKFEFFDINNNYVPIVVTSAKTFQSGNIGLIDKNITIDVDKQFFNFSSSLYPLPLSQSINIVGTKNRILGNLTLTRQVFDTGGFVISESVYGGAANYPGEFTYYHEDLYSFSASLDVTKFTGSLHNLPTQSGDTIVDRITYTLEETESTQPFIKRFTIGRLVAGASGQDGTDSKGLFVSSNTNQFFYKATNLSLNPAGQTILVQAKRQNLESLVAPIEVNSSSLAPALAIVGTIDGVTTYSLVGSSYPYSLGEVTYAFTGSDNLGVEYSDFVKISPVKVLDGFSVIATNENTSFPALSTGAISGSLNASSGSLLVKVGNEVISYSSLFVTNSYSASISSSTSAGVAANFNGINYSLSSLSVDSGSLVLDVKYKDGGGTIISSSKEITYSKVKKAAPVISFDIVNSNQSTDATSTGIQIGTFVPVTMSISDTYDGVTTRRLATSLNPTSIPNGAVIFGKTVSNEFITASLANGFDSADLVLNGSVLDSEGSSRNISGSISLSKVKKAAPVLEIITTNAAQSVSAKSTGEQIDTFTNSSVIVRQTYNGVTSSLTINSITASSSDISNIVASSGSASSTITLAGRNLGNGVNSTVITLTARVTDSESTNRILNDTITLSKIKKAVPLVLISASPQAQSVLANAAGTQTGTLSNVTISALEGTTSRFTSMTATYSGFSTEPNISTNVLNTSAAVMNAAEASATIVVTHTDSEGTAGQTQTIIVRFTKVPTGTTGAQGPSGSNGTNGNNGSDGRRTSTGFLYYQLTSATAPSTPTATSYTFSTNTFSGLTANWALGAPTFTAGNSNKYWFTTFTAIETTAGGNTAVPTFTTVTQAINFTGLVTFTSANNISDGTNTSNIVTPGVVTNHIGGANVTTINGGKVSTGVITSTGYSLAAGETLANGGYTLGGTILNLDNGSLRSRNFFISSSGDAFFRGNLAAAGGTFSGTLVAVGGDFSGTVTAGAGAIGGWQIGTSQINDTNNKMRLTSNPAKPALEIYDGTTLAVDISSATSLSTIIQGGSTTAGVPLSAQSTVQGTEYALTTYPEVNQIDYGDDPLFRTSGNPTFTPDQNGVYNAAITLGGSVVSAIAYIEPGGGGTTPGFVYLYASYTIGVSIRTGGANGTEVINLSQYVNWSQTLAGGASFSRGSTAGVTLTGQISVSSGTVYTLVPYIRFGQTAAQVTNGNFVTMDFTTTYRTPTITGAVISKPISKSELVAGGFQVVADTDRYCKIERNAANTIFVQVGGGISATGNIIAYASDRRLKENLIPIDNPLEKILKLNGVHYNWIPNKINELGFRPQSLSDTGLLAQEVEEVLPDAVKLAPFDNNQGVSISGENYLTVQYEKLVPLLVESIKELKKEVDELKKNR